MMFFFHFIFSGEGDNNENENENGSDSQDYDSDQYAKNIANGEENVHENKEEDLQEHSLIGDY